METVLDTFRPAPWAGRGKYKVAEVLSELRWVWVSNQDMKGFLQMHGVCLCAQSLLPAQIKRQKFYFFKFVKKQTFLSFPRHKNDLYHVQMDGWLPGYHMSALRCQETTEPSGRARIFHPVWHWVGIPAVWFQNGACTERVTWNVWRKRENERFQSSLSRRHFFLLCSGLSFFQQIYIFNFHHFISK